MVSYAYYFDLRILFLLFVGCVDFSLMLYAHWRKKDEFLKPGLVVIWLLYLAALGLKG